MAHVIAVKTFLYTRARATGLLRRVMYFTAGVALLTLLCAGGAMAQERQPPDSSGTSEEGAGSVRVSGGATLTGDVYMFESDPDGANRPRRPANLWRLILTPTVTVGDWLTLPFNIMLSSRETGVTTPASSSSSFASFLQNPGNTIGMLRISPRLSWASFHIGTHVPMYSELSSGDGQVFGAGFDLRPGKVRFSASAGTIQRSIEPDSAANIRGAYARWIYLAKLGYGSEDGSHVDLNFVRAKDDARSVARPVAGVDPQEGALITANTRVKLSEIMYLTGEAGTSIFTHDMNATDLANADKALNGIIRQRISSRQDYAGMLAFTITKPDWGVRALARYIGAGYVALGYPFLQPDRLEFALSPRVQLFENRLNVNATVGNRTNNLADTKSETSNQFIGSFNALGIVNDDVSVSLSYSNFGVRNNTSSDTLRIESVAQSLNLTPTYTIPTDAVIHTVSASYARDIFDDYNVVSGAANSNVTQSLMALYSASFIRLPLALNASVNRLTNDLPSGPLTLLSATLGASYRFLAGRLAPSFALTWSQSRVDVPGDERGNDAQIYVRLSLRWQVAKALTWNVAVSNNAYEYAPSRTRPGSTFNELFVQTSLATTF
ncbi:MAG: hypothetical protein HY962_09880 [Ignavibacteriae bacterium]|nr:hypothetical protein [Ignavibacteriota bacterium]